MAASGDMDAANADDGDPSSSNWPRTDLDFLRGHVTEAAPRPLPEPSVDSEGWQCVRKAVSLSPPRQLELESDDAEWQRPTRIEADTVVHDTGETTEFVSEAPESSNSKALKRRRYTQSTIGFGAGTPLVKPPPPPSPTVTPAPSRLKQTAAECAEAKFHEAQRNFITKWLPQFDWLLIDKGDDGLPCLRCSVFSEHGPDNARYGRNGSGGRDLQPASMRAHQASTRHEECIGRQKGLLDKLAAQKKIDGYERADPEGARVVRLMRSIQFVCDEDAPIAMYPRLVEFLAREGVSDIPQQGYGVYITEYGFKEMVKAMCTYQQQQQMMYIHASPWIDISCDERTDRARGKHLVVFATFLKGRQVATEFLALLTVQKCDAASIFTVLLSHLETVGLDLQRIVAISTDGAGVMIGTERGLVVRLRQRIPHLVGTHCIAHREVLAVKESAVKFKDLDIVDAAIRALRDIVTKSSVWHERFKELQQEMHKTSLEHQGLFDVRWLSRGDAVQRLCRVLGAAVVVFLEYDHKMAAVVQSLKFHFCLYFLADLLAEINALNRFFQRRKVSYTFSVDDNPVDITLVHQEVDRTIGCIRMRYVEYDKGFGGGVSKLLSPFIARMANGKRNIEVDGVDAEGEPTSHQIELSEKPLPGHNLKDMEGSKLYKVESWPDATEKRERRVVQWLDSNARVFKNRLPGFNHRAAELELTSFCHVMSRHYEDADFYQGLAKMMKTKDWPRSYPNLVSMWQALAVIPLSTVECKRGFSRQNVIKSWMRTSLGDARLSELMTLNMLDYEYKWAEVVEIWRKQKNRRPAKKPAPHKPYAGKGKAIVESSDSIM
ncbi:unnamed protein product [Closterium sp. NIES-54]